MQLNVLGVVVRTKGSGGQKWMRWIALVVLAGLLALNGVAWLQARAMTHFVESGKRTAKPEELSLPEKVWVVLTGVTVPRPENTRAPGDVGLEYETLNIEIGNKRSLEGWYVASGEAMGIALLFPGYAVSKESLLAQAVALNEIGWHTLMVDFRGAGGSSDSDTTLGLREAKDVAATVMYARSKWPGMKIALYGLSMGSAAVLRAVAVEGAEADGLIVESPFDSLLNTVRNRFGAMGLPGWPGAELVVFWGGVQIGADGFKHNPAEYALSVHVPTLLMHGEGDPRATMDEARAVYDSLNGPKWFVSFAGAGHESLVAMDEALWRSEVERFLNTIE